MMPRPAAANALVVVDVVAIAAAVTDNVNVGSSVAALLAAAQYTHTHMATSIEHTNRHETHEVFRFFPLLAL